MNLSLAAPALQLKVEKKKDGEDTAAPATAPANDRTNKPPSKGAGKK